MNINLNLIIDGLETIQEEVVFEKKVWKHIQWNGKIALKEEPSRETRVIPQLDSRLPKDLLMKFRKKQVKIVERKARQAGYKPPSKSQLKNAEKKVRQILESQDDTKEKR